MLTGKDIHAAWAYAENESTARRGFQPYERQKWGSLPETSKAKYELMAEFLNDKVNCEGCHRVEQMCICGGVPDEF